MATLTLAPFVVNVPEETLADLRSRLEATRWSTDLGNEDEYYGVGTEYLRGLVDYWRSGFDWRAAERRINELTHHRVEIEGVPVHFLRERGKGPAPIPLVLTHGWPWTFWDWSKVIRPLADPAAFGGDPADAFDVIVPSLPGYGFSSPLERPDLNFWKIADLWQVLMTEVLGHAKYAAAGADYGALVTAQLGHKYASSLYGIHLGHAVALDMFQTERPWDVTGGRIVPPGASAEERDDILRFQRNYASHIAVHMLDGQTITHALSDSPAGMLAWLLKRWRRWSDPHVDFESAFPRDHVLTNATIYWATGTIGSSIRAYANVHRYPWAPSHDRQPAVEAPAGFTFLVGETSRPETAAGKRRAAFLESPASRWYRPIYVKAHARGGHFMPWENPEATIEDLRATFRTLR